MWLTPLQGFNNFIKVVYKGLTLIQIRFTRKRNEMAPLVISINYYLGTFHCGFN